MVELATAMCSRRSHPTLATVFSLSALFVKRLGTKESVMGLPGQAGGGEGGRSSPLAQLLPQDTAVLFYPSLNI